MDRLDPICLRQRTPLRVRNGNHRRVGERVEHRLVFGQVEPTVQRGGIWRALSRKQRERIIIEMKVEKIEVVGAAAHVFKHRHVQRVRIADRAVEPQRARPECFKFCGSAGVAACKQRDLVTERHQFFCQPVNDAFGASVKLRRNRLGERRNLSNVHQWAPDRIEPPTPVRDPGPAPCRHFRPPDKETIFDSARNFCAATCLVTKSLRQAETAHGGRCC